MPLTFLGTAAANAYPEAFCSCGNCQQARALGGPSLRRRSSVIINDDLLIDLGPDIMTAAQAFNRPLTAVEYCLQTHAHSDHLDPSHLLSRSPGYGVRGAPRLHLYASSATLQAAALSLAADTAPSSLFDRAVGDRLNLELHLVEPGQTFTAGPYRVTAFAASHDPAVEPLLYAVAGEGRRIFYGLDTGPLPEETWRGLHDLNWQFDLVILDHTFGPEKTGCGGHLNADDFAAQLACLREDGLLAAGARVFGSHIAHDGNPPHLQLAQYAAARGYEIAYDGLTV